ncbi:T-cell immunoglobulin and mucin domain-containing protein 4-like isoform X2 [Heptranchias perlo]|uniref:T-cell immunoglobulin and mucin domain-containing protein 4-like isoform X2 n=1 Tax=Heptranchias perlo TaxID=212740 RepID=UPI0035597A58
MLVIWVVTHLTVLLVLLGPVTFVTGSEVRGVLGQSITLPCTYNVGRNGKTEMCWGRGQCPSMACTDPLIETNGKTVTFTKSSKYHLGGKLEEGDVSLTVNHLGEEDRGWYCCRVHIAEISTLTPLPSAVSLTTDHGDHITSNATEGNLNLTLTVAPDETSSLSQITVTNTTDTFMRSEVWVGAGFVILICLTGIAIFIFLKKQKKFTKDDCANSIAGMHTRQAVEENVYSIK